MKAPVQLNQLWLQAGDNNLPGGNVPLPYLRENYVIIIVYVNVYMCKIWSVYV